MRLVLEDVLTERALRWTQNVPEWALGLRLLSVTLMLL